MKILTLWAEATVKPSFVLLALITILMIWASDVLAYQAYAGNGNDCEGCHGGFTENPYSPPSGGTDWAGSLHSVHQSMVSFDCDTCHTGVTGQEAPPVFLESSNGGAGLATIGCVGCHGRDEDITGSSQRGAGLRQHHDGFASCGGCHSDQTGYTPVDEGVPPNYYVSPGTGHPNIPSNPCNPADAAFEENFAGTTLGLDNDGDGIYDMADVDCDGLPVELMIFEIE